MAFERIDNQPRAVALLRRALATGRVAHAYAFVGPTGAGRTTTALELARVLLCERHASAEPAHAAGSSGACRVCAMVESRQHPDLHVIVPTPPERNPKGPRAIRMETVREVERQAALRPALARRKIFILDDAERMTGESPQAFLKVLEEPPASTVFILVLPSPRAVPATVISRCQMVRFQARAGEARGACEDALAVFAAVRTGGADAMFKATDRVDRDRAEALVDGWWLLYRDLLLLRAGGPSALLVHGDRAEELAAEAMAWTIDDLLGGIETCRQARRALQTNVTPRLTLETILARLALRAA